MMEVAGFIGYNLQTVVVTAAVCLVVHNYVKKRLWDGLPPGPFVFPLLGSLPYLGPDLREPLRNMGKKYGDVFTIFLGSRRVVVLNSYDAIKDAFVKHGNVFSDRPNMGFISELTEGLGLVSASGRFWREQRKFAHNVLKDIGVGRSGTLMEGKVMEEVRHLVAYIEENMDAPMDPKYIVSTSVCNVVCSVVFGARFEYTDPEFKLYMKIMTECMELVGSNGILSVFPWLRYLPGDPFKGKLLIEQRDFMNSVFKKHIDAHKDAPRTTEHSQDFIDAYLSEMENHKGVPGTSFYEYQLVRIIGDLFTAGTETTTTTLQWAMVYLMKYPHIQEKIYREIVDVIGTDRPPTTKDREQLVYTEACLCEIQRMADITPLNVPHCTSDDVMFRGYHIPKDTMIFSSLYSVHRDERTWKNPFEFDPENFLNSAGQLEKSEQLIPFSIGRRMCLGDGLAKMELYLFLVSMLQKFEFTLADGEEMPSMVGKVAVTHMPQRFKVTFKSRSTPY